MRVWVAHSYVNRFLKCLLVCSVCIPAGAGSRWSTDITDIESCRLLFISNGFAQVSHGNTPDWPAIDSLILSKKALPSFWSFDKREVELAQQLDDYQHEFGSEWLYQLKFEAFYLLLSEGLIVNTRKTVKQRKRDFSDFVIKRKTSPKKSSMNRMERSLSSWFWSYKQLHPTDWDQDVSEEAIRILKERGLYERRRKTTAERVDEYNLFVARFGRPPTTSAINQLERELARWQVSFQRYRKQNWYQIFSSETIRVLKQFGKIESNAEI